MVRPPIKDFFTIKLLFLCEKNIALIKHFITYGSMLKFKINKDSSEEEVHIFENDSSKALCRRKLTNTDLVDRIINEDDISVLRKIIELKEGNFNLCQNCGSKFI